jgi:cell fate (sporulation/competence/biofilm development) regulator YmcA (YheA/YmcA/DUF963 family)
MIHRCINCNEILPEHKYFCAIEKIDKLQQEAVILKQLILKLQSASNEMASTIDGLNENIKSIFSILHYHAEGGNILEASTLWDKLESFEPISI